uniref:Uncharacterized protein n=1 Tax=Rhizophora mucronata TaxID=61149 RepID=A0A2P2P032_RHIMU
MDKDILDQTTETDLNLKAHLADAYLHPIFHSFEEEDVVEVEVNKEPARTSGAANSEELSSPSPPHASSPQHHVYHPSSPPIHVYHPYSPSNRVYHPYSPPQHVYHSPLPPHYIYEAPLPPEYMYHYGNEP